MNALATQQTARALRSVPHVRAPSEDDIAALPVEGEVVIVDVSDFDLDGKTLAAVSKSDGTLCLAYPKLVDGAALVNRRCGFFYRAARRDERPVRNTNLVMQGCIVLGAVISRE